MFILCRPLKRKKTTVNTCVAGLKTEPILQSTIPRIILPLRLISATTRSAFDQITWLAVTANPHECPSLEDVQPRSFKITLHKSEAPFTALEATKVSAHDWTQVAVQGHLFFPVSESSTNHIKFSRATRSRQTLSLIGPIVLPLRWRMVGTGGFRKLARHRTISLIIISPINHSDTQLATALLSIAEEVIMPMKHLRLLVPQFRKLPLTTHIPCTVKGINRANT